MCCWQQIQRPHVHLQRRLLRQRSHMHSLQDLCCSKLILQITMHGWKLCRHRRLLLQRWILWRRHSVLSMQDVLAKRHTGQLLFRQHDHRHVHVQV